MRALVVDDVPSMRHFLCMCLGEHRDLQIDQAEDGLKALKLINEKRYDIILLDLNLPLLDGLKVLITLRQRKDDSARTPVIVITTTSDPEVLDRLSALNADYLPKPAKAFELRDRVRNVLQMPISTEKVHERRREPRLAATIRVKFEPHPALDLRSEDLNALGAFLACETIVPVGTTGVATLYFPHLPEPIMVTCRVVHVRPNAVGAMAKGFGIRFEPENTGLSVRLVRAFLSPV